jgi:hypothetical protein
MNKAASAGIQAFALNMAADWPYNEQALDYAFSAAAATKFKLFFSFDYPGGAYPWDQNVVISYLKKWGSNTQYWQHVPGRPLASTFEGPGNAGDWKYIKAQTNCFFMPDWSSVGAFPAVGLADGVADGLFSWAAWPYGKRKTDTYTDHSYLQALGHDDPKKTPKPYMMPVSPWFFTNLPGKFIQYLILFATILIYDKDSTRTGYGEVVIFGMNAGSKCLNYNLTMFKSSLGMILVSLTTLAHWTIDSTKPLPKVGAMLLSILSRTLTSTIRAG